MPGTKNLRVAFDRLARNTREQAAFDELRKLINNNDFLHSLNGILNDVHTICDQDYEIVYKSDGPIIREISLHERRTVEQSARVAVIRCSYQPPT